ncbi:MAG: hypothetical protein E7648_03600 [Ruminococcaceae bacterium]|nr:hypothetical protein [Oscillospiraceae bacterium]
MNKMFENPELEEELRELELRKKELKARKKEEKRKNHSQKKGGLVALCVILAILSVSLSVAMFFSIKDILQLKNETKEELALMQANLNACESNLENYKTWYNDSKDALADAKAQISALQKENEALKEKLASSDPANVKYSYSFNSVLELMTAIKKNPSAYNNKQVKVIGTAIKKETNGERETLLLDLSSGEVLPDTSSTSFDIEYYIWLQRKEETGKIIDITIADDVFYAVLKTGDYIKLYGTVCISNGEIDLDKCSYDLILSGN